MEPIPLPPTLTTTPDPGGPGGQDAAFQAIFREQLQRAQDVRGQDMTADARAFGQNFMMVEGRSRLERFNLMSSLLPSDFAARSGTGGSWSQGGGRDAAAGYREAHAKAVYSDQGDGTIPPILQSALGLPADASMTGFDFGAELRALTSRFDGKVLEINDKIRAPVGNTIQESVRHNSEVQALMRQADTLNTTRSMMGTMQIASFQEFRTRVAMAFEHFTGAMKKLNEIFTSLKQSG
jgi:hypothetical protein